MSRMWAAVWGAATWFSAPARGGRDVSVGVLRTGLCTIKMPRFAVFVVLAILCATNSIAWDDLQALKMRAATVYCGKNLSEVLSLVCRGRYNTPPGYHNQKKRDIHVVQLDTFPLAPSIDDILTHKSRRRFYKEKLKARKRLRRGVYNECCQKPCSYAVLKTYCADD